MDHHHHDLDEPSKVVVPVVVMVPFIAHGHLNQLIHLSNILVSTYNVPVHVVCTATSLAQSRTRLPATNNPMIIFHEFTTPPFASPPPDPSIAFPAHQQSSFDSTLHLRHPVTDLVTLLSKTAPRVVVIHDTLMSYVVQDVVFIPNVETFNFRPLSAFYYFWDFWDKLGRPFEVGDDDMLIYNKLPSQHGIVTPEFKAFARLQYPHMNNVVGDLFDSSRVIEGEYIEYLERQEISGQKRIWAIGPINPVQIETETDVVKNRHHCLRWLDEQAKNSVIYVSFGTTTTFSKDQIRELAIGLEKSGKRFIWVVRPADVGDVVRFQVELPDGFEERAKGRGLIERGWAPQLEILGHFATGGFMSHCGWNSCMESMSMGVPMATWPMHSDQRRNAVLITQVLRIGVVVKDWEHRSELVRDMVVKEAVEKLMDSKEGDEMRKSAAMLGDSIKKSMMEGGVSRLEMDSFISYISRCLGTNID